MWRRRIHRLRDVRFKKLLCPHKELVSPIIEGRKGVGKIGIDQEKEEPEQEKIDDKTDHGVVPTSVSFLNK